MSILTVCKAQTAGRLNDALGEPIGQLQPRTSKQVNKAGSNLGVNIHLGANVTEYDIDLLGKTGVAWAGINFMRKDDEALNLEHIDALVSHLKRNGINIMGRIAGIHKVYDSDRRSVPVATPETFESYKSNLALIAERYGDDVYAWEIGNEVDNALFWQPEPDPNEYETVFNVSVDIIRSFQPDAKFISGSTTCFFHSDYLEELIDCGIISTSNFYGIHPFRHLPEYGDGITPHKDDYAWLMTRLRSVNPDIEIWNTEVQAFAQSDIGAGPVGHERHARMLLRRFIVEKELGYHSTLWHMYKALEADPYGRWSAADHPGQLLNIQSEPTEKYYALQNLGAWLDGDIVDANDINIQGQIVKTSDPLQSSWYQLDQPGIRSVEGSEFSDSAMNTSTTVVDVFYIRDCGLQYLPGLCVLREDDNQLPYYHGQDYDQTENIGSWYRTEGENGALFIILAKGQTPVGRTFELENIEIALREGREVEVSSSLFLESANSQETDPYGLYYMKPIHVTPTGTSYAIEVNGEIWPIAFPKVGGLKPKHYRPSGEDTLYLMPPQGTTMEDYNVKLLPPEIPPVHVSAMKHKSKLEYYITYWQTSYPCEDPGLGTVTLEIENLAPELFSDAVCVDLMSGEVFQCPEPTVQNSKLVFELPLVDWPILLRSGFGTKSVLNLK